MIDGTGIKIMASAATREAYRLDSTSRNIANVNTAGFKAEWVRFLEGGVERKAAQGPTATIDYSQGALQKTGNVLDLAIEGDGFFTLQGKDGIAYTRDGRATLNEEGELVSLSGEYFLGKGGKITISGDDIQVCANGSVLVDGNEVDTLKIAGFQNPSALVQLNARLYINNDDAAGMREEEKPQVRSGFMELSNVQIVREMVEMINIQRTFESYQKAIQTIDEQNEASTSRIGRL